MTRAALLVVAALLWLGAGADSPVQAQPDSVRAEILERRGFDPDHSPSGALWRGLVAPGWGQLYNHDYLKVPFVWGGLAGMGGLVYWTNDQYLLYRRAGLYRIGRDRAGENEPNEYAEFRNAYEEAAAPFGGEASFNQLKDRRDAFRSRRDLSIVGTGLFYALTVLDAYVSAHLLTFDVSDDLAVRAHPTGRLPPSATASPSDASDPAGVLGPGPTAAFDHAATLGPGVTVRVRF